MSFKSVPFSELSINKTYPYGNVHRHLTLFSLKRIMHSLAMQSSKQGPALYCCCINIHSVKVVEVGTCIIWICCLCFYDDTSL